MSNKPGVVGAKCPDAPSIPKSKMEIPCPPESHHLFPSKFSGLLSNSDYEINASYNLVDLHRCTHRLLSCRGFNEEGELPHDKDWQIGVKKGKDWPACSPGVHTNSRIPATKNNGIRPFRNQLPKRPNNNNWIKDWGDYVNKKGFLPFPAVIVMQIGKMRNLYKI